ncbi:MAG: GNAT family N-acetyltransferase, partial [Actinomycetota bacterium]
TSTLAEEPGGGPMYVFPDDIAPDPHAVEISPGMFAWKVDGRAVAWCFSSRDIGEAVQAGVETKEEFRGRGFAPRVVSTWGAAMKDRGVEPIYSTSRANLASQSVARKLGLICIGSDFNVH